MKELRCPHCGSSAHVDSHLTVLLAIEDFPLATLFTAVVVIIGNVLAVASEAIAVGLLIAVLPLFLSFFRKFYCERCEIEFREPESLAEGGSRKSKVTSR